VQHYHKKLIIVVLLPYVFMRLMLSNDDHNEDAPAFGKRSNLLLGICLTVDCERPGEEGRHRNRSRPHAPGYLLRQRQKVRHHKKTRDKNTQAFHGKFEHRATSSVANGATKSADQGQVRPGLCHKSRSGRKIMQSSQF